MELIGFNLKSRKKILIYFCLTLIFSLLFSNCSKNKSENNPNNLNNQPLNFTSQFSRYSGNPILNPRNMVSPITDTRKIGFLADPCSFWDQEQSVWRIFWTFWDVEADLAGQGQPGIWGATSKDGLNFETLDELALNSLGTFDQESVETCDVIKAPDPNDPSQSIYFMYYSGNSDNGEGLFKMGLALSRDGIHFDPISSSLSPKNQEGLLFTIQDSFAGAGENTPGNFITDPTVVYRNGEFKMWSLCIQQFPAADANGGICYHTSSDGINWTHLGIVNGLDGVGFPIQPTVYFNENSNEYEMLFVGDTPADEGEIHNPLTNLSLRVKGWYGARSTDGFNWQLKSEERLFIENTNLLWENSGVATGADATVKDGNLYFHYPSLTTEGGSVFADILNWPINLATKKLD